MSEPGRLIFIHGLEGTSQGVKATLLRELFPGILTPDFSGLLDERMAQLEAILGETSGWTMIGSSFGGLMAAKFACAHPQQVEKLILLAPALIWPDFAQNLPAPVNIPVVVYQGIQDALIPPDANRQIAEKLFTNLTFHVVDDDHGLYRTVHEVDWKALLS